MLNFNHQQSELLARVGLVDRLVEMLIETESVHPESDRGQLRARVAEILDEAFSHGIRTERLLGMYLLLRLVDGVEPFGVRGYADVLARGDLAEADRAHLIQMIRLGEIETSGGSA